MMLLSMPWLAKLKRAANFEWRHCPAAKVDTHISSRRGSESRQVCTRHVPPRMGCEVQLWEVRKHLEADSPRASGLGQSKSIHAAVVMGLCFPHLKAERLYFPPDDVVMYVDCMRAHSDQMAPLQYWHERARLHVHHSRAQPKPFATTVAQ